MATVAAALMTLSFGAMLLAVDPTFYWKGDTQIQYMPGAHDVARAVLSGEFPFSTRFSWNGAAQAAEYQYGVFSVFELALNAIVWSVAPSIPAAATATSLVLVAVLGAGCHRLARGLGLPLPESFLVVAVGTCNGWMLQWGVGEWTPSLHSFAWLPWTWWAMERAADPGRSRAWVGLAGVFVYLVLASGWPFTNLMLALVAVYVVASRFQQGRAWPAFRGVAAASLLGIAWSAPALCTLIWYASETFRTRGMVADAGSWVTPLSAMSGLVLPSYPVFWKLFTEFRPHASVEFAGGIAPVAAMLGILLRGRFGFFRSNGCLFLLLVVSLALATSPSLPPLRWSFRWLPFVHLVLAIVGARAIYELRSASDPTRTFRGLKRVLARAFRGVAWLVFVPGVYLAVRASWFEMDKDVHSSWLGAALVVLGATWVLFEAVTSPTALARVWFATALTLLQVGMVVERLPSGTIVPAWRFAEDPRTPQPFRTDVAYLAAYRWEDMVALVPAWRAEGYELVGVSSDMRPGSLSLHAGVEFVNGYSPMHPKALGEVFGFELHGAAGEQNLHRVLSADDRRYGILRWMAVDGLVVGSAFGGHLEGLATKGWRRASDLSAGVMLERTGPATPRVRALASAEFVSREAWDLTIVKPVSSPRAVLVDDLGARNGVHEFANVEIGDWERRRNEASVTVKSAEPTKDALLLFSMPWLPGHRAFLGGEEVPVLRAFGFMPAVVLPAGRTGVVTVRYRPRGFEVGMLAAVIGLAVAIGWVGLPSLREVRRRQPLTDSNDASRQI